MSAKLGMYPITSIEDDAPEFPEQLGTKRKFWLHIGEQRYLFKIGRAGTGENWAEKVAAEISETAAHFALTMLELNQSRLLHGELKP